MGRLPHFWPSTPRSPHQKLCADSLGHFASPLLLSTRARPTDNSGPLLSLTVLTALTMCHRDVVPTRQPEDPFASIFSARTRSSALAATCRGLGIPLKHLSHVAPI